MEAITKNAAIIIMGTEDIMGNMEGKAGSFYHPGADPIAVEPINIKNIKILAAVHKGKMS